MAAGGPKTPEGKARVARNALRHGVLSPNPVVGSIEKRCAWLAHQREVIEALAPEGSMEHALADRVALNLWRLGRVVRFETEAVAAAQERVEQDWTDAFGARHLNSAVTEDGPAGIFRQPSILGYWLDLVTRLPGLPPGEPLSCIDVEAVFFALGRAFEKGLESLAIPGLQPGDRPSSRAEWTVGELRVAWNTVCRRLETDPADAWRLAREALIEERDWAALEAVEVRRELATFRRERLLPRPAEMERVSRYEAHLSRELYRALHELEAMQARRRGHQAPLARVDINGVEPT